MSNNNARVELYVGSGCGDAKEQGDRLVACDTGWALGRTRTRYDVAHVVPCRYTCKSWGGYQNVA